MKLSFLLATLIFGTAAQAKPHWSVYVVDWGYPSDSVLLTQNLKSVDTVWMRMFQVLPNGHLNLKWKPEGPVVRVLEKLAKPKKLITHQPDFGPILQNTGPNGFSATLGKLMLASIDTWFPDLVTLQKEWKFTSLQLDIEELLPEDAAVYESGVKKLAQLAQGANLHFVIALHAQTESPSKNQNARFQRWEELKKISVKKNLMALDYSWASGEPGPIAPLEWTERLVTRAKIFFKPQDLMVTLPVYGYHWRKGKAGEPALAEDLKKLIAAEPAWKRDSTKNESVYRKDDEVISFDSTESVREKKSALQKLGIRSFGFWRVGGENESIYR
jgi:spore germination protein YaaH